MFTSLMMILWLGGMRTAFLHYTYTQKQTIGWCIFHAFVWPIDFGEWIAEKIYDAKEDSE